MCPLCRNSLLWNVRYEVENINTFISWIFDIKEKKDWHVHPQLKSMLLNSLAVFYPSDMNRGPQWGQRSFQRGSFVRTTVKGLSVSVLGIQPNLGRPTLKIPCHKGIAHVKKTDECLCVRRSFFFFHALFSVREAVQGGARILKDGGDGGPIQTLPAGCYITR